MATYQLRQRDCKFFPLEPARALAIMAHFVPRHDAKCLADRGSMKFESLRTYDGGEPRVLHYQISPDQITFLTGLMEAYEGIGLVRTLDAARGIIECWVMPDGIEVFETILRSFRRTAEIQPMDRDFD